MSTKFFRLIIALLFSTLWTAPAFSQVTKKTFSFTPYLHASDYTGTNLAFDVYLPDPALFTAPYPTVVMIHGGGFSAGSRADYAGAQGLTQNGFIVVNTDYRLASGTTNLWPAQRIDMERLITFLKSPYSTSVLKINPNKIAAIGASAGGLLAAFTGDNAKFKKKVAKVITFNGPWDMVDVVSDLRQYGFNAGEYSADAKGMAMNLLFGPGTPADEAGWNIVIARAVDATPNFGYNNPATPILDSTLASAVIVRGSLDTLIPIRQAASGFTMVQTVSGSPGRAIYYEAAGEGHGLSAEVQYMVVMNPCVLGGWVPPYPACN